MRKLTTEQQLEAKRIEEQTAITAMKMQMPVSMLKYIQKYMKAITERSKSCQH
jgi:hypothetical protein